MDASKDDLKSFLEKVDEVGSLIKDLSSEDDNKKLEALKRSDAYLKEKGELSSNFDSSRINKYEDVKRTDQRQGPGSYFEASISPEQFIKDVEEDAANRKREKLEKEKKSSSLKTIGNDMFKKGEFTEAIKYYSEAIKLTSDNPVLYTNRAQAYGRLSQYDLALKDCDTALFIDQKCVKAHVHRGKALQHIHKYEEALESFNNAIKADKKQISVVEGYIKELERNKVKFAEESQASLAAEEDDTHDSIKQSIGILRKSASEIDEGVKELAKLHSLIEIRAGNVTFRKYGGFKIFLENPTISRVWKSGSNTNSEDALLTEGLQLLLKATENNDINVREFCSLLPISTIWSCLSRENNNKLQTLAARFLFQISQVEEGRNKMTADGDSKKAIDLLITAMSVSTEMAHLCIGTINNLALVTRFAEEHGEKLVNDLIPSFLTVAEFFRAATDSNLPMDAMITAVSSTFNTFVNLAKVPSIRGQLANNEKYWKASEYFLAKYSQNRFSTESKRVVLPLLRLLGNICTGTDVKEEFIFEITDYLLVFCNCKDTEVTERLAYIFSRLITMTKKTRCEMVKEKYYEAYLRLPETSTEEAKGYIMKCVAVCAQDSKACRDLLCQEKYTSLMFHVLRGKHLSAVGNAALCFAACGQEEKFASKLKGTDIIPELLKIAANDEISGDVRYNAAIAIAKLVASNSSHLDKLRDLHGFEILHEVLQDNKT